MSGGLGGVAVIIITMCAVQVVSSLLMIISIWFSSACRMNIQYIGAVTIIVPLLCALCVQLYSYRARSFFAITGVFVYITIIGVLVYIIGYICMLVALIINQIHTPQCIQNYAKGALWLSLSLAIFNCIFPLILTLQTSYRNWRANTRYRKLRKDMREILMRLYEARDTLGNKARVEKLRKLSNQLPGFLKSEPFSPEEIDLLLKNHGLVFTSSDDSHIECQSCGERLKIGGEYAQIPGCSHIACRECIEGWCASNTRSKKCDVCDNNIRMAFLTKAQGEETIRFIMNNPE